MARKMIQLAGYKPEIDIPIEFSGLRKGEKLHEELFKTEENPLPTYHPKIMKAQHSPVPVAFQGLLSELLSACTSNDHLAIRSLIRRIVPEYSYRQDSGDADVKVIRPLPSPSVRMEGALNIGNPK
jgi:O-antigen biosynthesis protein WbqV